MWARRVTHAAHALAVPEQPGHAKTVIWQSFQAWNGPVSMASPPRSFEIGKTRDGATDASLSLGESQALPLVCLSHRPGFASRQRVASWRLWCWGKKNCCPTPAEQASRGAPGQRAQLQKHLHRKPPAHREPYPARAAPSGPGPHRR